MTKEIILHGGLYTPNNHAGITMMVSNPHRSDAAVMLFPSCWYEHQGVEFHPAPVV